MLHSVALCRGAAPGAVGERVARGCASASSCRSCACANGATSTTSCACSAASWACTRTTSRPPRRRCTARCSPGMLTHIGTRTEERDYEGVRGRRFALHPGSACSASSRSGWWPRSWSRPRGSTRASVRRHRARMGAPLGRTPGQARAPLAALVGAHGQGAGQRARTPVRAGALGQAQRRFRRASTRWRRGASSSRARWSRAITEQAAILGAQPRAARRGRGSSRRRGGAATCWSRIA